MAASCSRPTAALAAPGRPANWLRSCMGDPSSMGHGPGGVLYSFADNIPAFPGAVPEIGTAERGSPRGAAPGARGLRGRPRPSDRPPALAVLQGALQLHLVADGDAVLA